MVGSSFFFSFLKKEKAKRELARVHRESIKRKWYAKTIQVCKGVSKNSAGRRRRRRAILARVQGFEILRHLNFPRFNVAPPHGTLCPSRHSKCTLFPYYNLQGRCSTTTTLLLLLVELFRSASAGLRSTQFRRFSQGGRPSNAPPRVVLAWLQSGKHKRDTHTHG